MTIATVWLIVGATAISERNHTTINVESTECIIKLGAGGIYHVPLPEGAVCKDMKTDKVFGNYVTAEATIQSAVSNGMDLDRYSRILKEKNWRVERDPSGLTASSGNPQGGFLTVSSKGDSWLIKISWFGD